VEEEREREKKINRKEEHIEGDNARKTNRRLERVFFI